MINSCYKCEERHPNCHSHCERYISQKAAHDKIRESERQARLHTELDFERRLRLEKKRRNHN